MPKTQTSAFGVSARVSHDARAFYARRLFNQEAIERDLGPAYTGPREGFANYVFHGDSRYMNDLPTGSVGLAFTSPSYNVGKEYDLDLPLDEYLDTIYQVAQEVYRVLTPGGRYVVNVANVGRKPYIPLTRYFYEVHEAAGFLSMGEIIWQKGKGASGSCAWGSWQSAKAPRLRDLHEYLLVFTKGLYGRPDKGESTIGKEEFMAGTLSVWNIRPESAKRIGHPAPFPVELAKRVIELYSFKEDIVLDPFCGSGTTLLAAKELGRDWVGYDINQEYVLLSERRLGIVS